MDEQIEVYINRYVLVYVAVDCWISIYSSRGQFNLVGMNSVYKILHNTFTRKSTMTNCKIIQNSAVFAALHYLPAFYLSNTHISVVKSALFSNKVHIIGHYTS